MNSKISLIAAISENKVIGRDNKLPWHISADLKRFKALTLNHPIIMGRKTYESIGKPLPNRTNIVITRDENYKLENCCIAHSLDKAIQIARQQPGGEEIFVIGGGQIFNEAILIADKLYLTIIHTIVEGDVYFPDYSEFKHEVFSEKGSEAEFIYTFMDLTK